MKNKKLYWILIVTIVLSNCGPGTTYLIVSEIFAEKKALRELDITLGIDTLNMNKITNEIIQRKVTEVTTFLETYFMADSSLIDDKIYLEKILAKTSQRLKTKKVCLTSYCITSDICIPLSGIMLVFALDASPYDYLMSYIPPLTLVVYLTGGLIAKRLYNRIVVSPEEIKTINGIIHEINSRIENMKKE